MSLPSKQRKLVIFGSYYVGKTSLAARYTHDRTIENHCSTIENSFSTVIKYKGQEFAMEIVDTAGQDEYSLSNPMHFIGIHGYMLVYSVASKQSYEMVQVIHSKILCCLGIEWVPIVVVGNMSDLLSEQRQVTVDDGHRLAGEFDCAWIEASAKSGINVTEAFEMLIGQIETPRLNEPSGLWGTVVSVFVKIRYMVFGWILGISCI